MKKSRKTEAFRDFVSVKVRNNPNFSAWITPQPDEQHGAFKDFSQIASASWTPAGRNFVIIATVLVGASDSTKIGAAAAGQAA